MTGYEEQTTKCIGGEDVTIVESDIDTSYEKQQNHSPCKTNARHAATQHDVESKSKQKCEDTVHLTRQEEGNDTIDGGIARQSEICLGTERIERLYCVEQDDAHDRDATQSIGHFDSTF